MRITTITKPISNFLTKPKVLAPTVFLGIGAMKTILDYQKAPQEEKTQTLLKNTSILTGSALAFCVTNPIMKKFCNTSFFKLFSEGFKTAIQKITKKQLKTHKVLQHTGNLLDKTEYVLKNTIAGTINTLAGILGAVFTDAFMEKFVFSKPPFTNPNKDNKEIIEPQITETDKHSDDLEPEENPSNKNNDITPKKDLSQNGYFTNSQVFNRFNSENILVAKKTANIVISTVSDLPEMKLLSSPMIALTGYSIAKTEGYNNKAKKACYELLANTLIPTLFIATTSLFVENKKGKIKYPSLLLSLLCGAFTGKKLADKFQEKMDKQIDKINMNKYFM